jgi:2-keto-4-pentenoate hydratase
MHNVVPGWKNCIIAVGQHILPSAPLSGVPAMSDASTHAAQHLASARRDHRVLPGLPPDCRPKTIDEGYAVQAAFRNLWPHPVAGWKVGATALPVQALFKVGHPFYGPIFGPTVLKSPAAPRASDYFHLTIESEFVFRLGADLPARPNGYTKADVVAAFGEVMPGLEIVGGRYPGLTSTEVASVIADCAGNEGVVVGRPAAGWKEADLIAQHVRLEVNGRIVGDGSGADVLGSPVRVLEWLVTDMSKRGISMAAGQLVSTGTCTGVITIGPGERAVADFGSLGQVEVCFG